MSGVNAFQHNAFQQTAGKVAFQLLASATTVGGRTFEAQKWWDKQRQYYARHEAAVSLGRAGGLVGGPARAESLTPKQLSKQASYAAKHRWK